MNQNKEIDALINIITTGLDPDDGVDVGDAAAGGRAGTEAGAGRMVSISCAIMKERSFYLSTLHHLK